MFSVRIVDSLPYDQWMKFVYEHPEGNIFHTPHMMDVFRNADKHYPNLHAAIDERNGNILSLLLSVQVSVFGKLTSRVTSRSIIYGGVLCAGSADGKDSLVPLMNTYNTSVKDRVLFTEIRNVNPTKQSRSKLEKCGYKYQDYLNYLIDLRRPLGEIFKSFSSSCRRNIRKSQRNGILIDEITSKEKLPVFYALLKKTYSGGRVPLADFSLFASAFNNLHFRKMVRFFLARLDDQYVAARVILLFKNQIFDWYAGADDNYLDLYPNELLVHHILSWGSKNGFQSFDFGGAGRPDEKYGVRDFKERFGGQVVNYGRYTNVYSARLYNVSNIGYRLYRKFL
jgi:lipid II:glycine glycyltransferase (peptidoglycan interpeptide bridge formation enzyme)